MQLSVNNVSVANVEPFLGDTLFKTKNLTATINLMSVISGDQYEIRKILLDAPVIRASIRKDGTASYDIAKIASSPDTVAAPADTSGPLKFKMSLKSLEIRNALIQYTDEQGNMSAGLDSFNFSLSGDFSQDNFELQNEISIGALNFTMDNIPYLKNVRTNLRSTMDADMPGMKFTMKENEVSLNELDFGITGWFAMLEKGYDMDLSFKCLQSEFKNFLSLVPGIYTKDFASVKSSGSLSFDGYAKGKFLNDKLPSFGLGLKINNAMFQYPSLPKAVNNIFVDLSIENASGDPDATVTDLNRFHMEMAGNPVDMVMHIVTPVSDPGIQGQVLGKIDLASLKDVVPVEQKDALNGKIDADVKLNGKYSSIEQQKYEEFDAKGSVNVSEMKYASDGLPGMHVKTMSLEFSPRFVALNGFDAVMGRSDFKASGRIENFMQYFFKDSLLKGTFDLRSGLTDLNEFMSTDSSAAASTDTSILSVIEVPGNIDFVLNSTISQLNYDQLTMKDVKGEVVVRDSKVILNNLFMNLLGGSMKMNGDYSTLDPRSPKVKMTLNVKDFDIPQTYKYFNTVQKLAPIAQYTNGRFSTDISYTSSLDQHMTPVLNTLEGSGKLRTSKVTVSNFEPLNKLAEALGGFDKFKKADFSDMDIAYAFKDGKVTYDKFPFKSGSVSGDVEGTTGFDQTINYKMSFEVPTKDMPAGAQQMVSGMLSKANMLGANAKMPEKVKLNALFGGTVKDPKVQTDVKEIAGNVVEDVKTQLLDTGKKIVEEKIQEIKKDLTAEKEKIMKDAQVAANEIKEQAAKSAAGVKAEGYAKAEELEKSAKNPIEKITAKKAADQMRKTTDEKCNKIVEEGNKKADKVMEDARTRADALK